jgi:uncharacterized protein YxjI
MRSGVLIGFLCGIGLACGRPAESPGPKGGVVIEKENAAGAPVAAEKIALKNAEGATLCKIKPKNEGYRVYDGADQALGEVKVQDDRVKLKDAQDVERIKIKRKEYGAEIETAAGERLYKIKISDEGLKLEDAAGATLVKCKAKEQGIELRDASGATIAKVKPRAARLVFETEDGARLSDLDGTTNARAGMWFALERFSLPERAALYAYFERVAP